jgi:hypothetical protein
MNPDAKLRNDYFGLCIVAEFEASLYRLMDQLIALDHERGELARQLATAAQQLGDIRKQLAKVVRPQPTAEQDKIVSMRVSRRSTLSGARQRQPVHGAARDEVAA